ncbi:MAG: heme-copper oxidase subunit III [Pyrinomonadaceae bacterium]
MVTSTKTATKRGTSGGPKFPGPNGNGSKRKDGNGFFRERDRGRTYRIGMWMGLASITMLFTALTSAYIVRAASANDWTPLAMPRALLFSTGLILASSGALELARRKLRTNSLNLYARWLLLTVLLALSFLGSQLLAWKQLARQGIYLVSNPHSSFFYLLTAAHAFHFMGGLLALLFLLMRANRTLTPVRLAKRGAAVDAVAIYWHFMDGLWIYLFLLLFLWQ